MGNRKLILGLVYLVGCFTVSGLAVYQGATGWEAAGVAALFGSIATGLGVVVWGNVEEHRARGAR